MLVDSSILEIFMTKRFNGIPHFVYNLLLCYHKSTIKSRIRLAKLAIYTIPCVFCKIGVDKVNNFVYN